MKKIQFKAPYYFYIFIVIDTTETGMFFGSNKYRFKLGFTRNIKKRMCVWRNDLKNMLKKYGYPENALVIDDENYFEIPGVFEMDGKYILIGKDNRYIERFDQDLRNCLYEMGLTKMPNCDIKPLEKFGIDEVFSIEGLNLYDDKTFDDIKEFINNVFIPGIKNHYENYKQYYFVLSESEYDDFCKNEVNKIDRDISNLTMRQLKDHIKLKYDVDIHDKFLSVINIENNSYDDIGYLYTHIMSYNPPKDWSKYITEGYNKVISNYQVRKCIEEWIFNKKEKNEEKNEEKNGENALF